MKIINISVERAQNGILYSILTFVKFEHKFLKQMLIMKAFRFNNGAYTLGKTAHCISQLFGADGGNLFLNS